MILEAIIQKPAVQEEEVRIVKMHQDVQVSKLIEIQSKVTKLKSSIDEFSQCIQQYKPIISMNMDFYLF